MDEDKLQYQIDIARAFNYGGVTMDPGIVGKGRQ